MVRFRGIPARMNDGARHLNEHNSLAENGAERKGQGPVVDVEDKPGGKGASQEIGRGYCG
jgi:hypothetical protein